MRNFAIFAAVTAVTLTLAGGAQAQEAGKPGKGAGKGQGGFGRRTQNMAESLNLTEAQKTKIKAIEEKYRPKMMPIMQDSKLTREQKGAKLRPIRTEMEKEFMAVLTPEQRAKVKQMRENARKNMAARGKGGPAGAPGAPKKP